MTKTELAYLATHPDALRALADYHSVQETMAAAVGPETKHCVEYHEKKRLRYDELADQQQARIDNGDDPLPDTDGIGTLED